MTGPMKTISKFASALTTVSVLVAATLPAQGSKTRGVAPTSKVAPPPALGKKALTAKLDAFRQEIAAKMVPANIAKQGKRRTTQWLKKFQVVQGKHYHVFTNGPKTSSRRFAKSLEKLYQFVQKTWPFEDVGHHHRAYIFASKEQYWDFCTKVRGWSRAQATRSAGHACGAYYAAYYQSPKAEVVMHEATHQIVHANLKIRGVGSWFQEGMAQYAAGKILRKRISGSMRSRLRNGDSYAFPEFVKIPSLIADRHSRRNYEQAGCIVEFLMETKSPEMRGKFAAFLRAAANRRFAMQRGSAATIALFKEVYGMTLEEVETAFRAFHRVKPRG